MQVEHQLAGGVMGHHGLVHMHRPLGCAGGAAGEMQQRRFLRIGSRNAEALAGLLQQFGEIERARGDRFIVRRAHQQHMAQSGQQMQDRNDFPLVKRGRGEQHPRIAQRHARADRFRSEGGKQGADHAAVLPRAQCRDIQLWNAPGEDVDTLARAHFQLPQDIGKAVGALAQAGIGKIQDGTVPAQPAYRDVFAARARRMAIDRLVGYVEPARGQAVEFAPGFVPGEAGAERGIIANVRRHGVAGRIAGNGFYARRRCITLCFAHVAQAPRGASEALLA